MLIEAEAEQDEGDKPDFNHGDHTRVTPAAVAVLC